MRSVRRRDLLRAEALAEVVRPQVKQAQIPVVEIKAGSIYSGVTGFNWSGKARGSPTTF